MSCALLLEYPGEWDLHRLDYHNLPYHIYITAVKKTFKEGFSYMVCDAFSAKLAPSHKTPSNCYAGSNQVVVLAVFN